MRDLGKAGAGPSTPGWVVGQGGCGGCHVVGVLFLAPPTQRWELEVVLGKWHKEQMGLESHQGLEPPPHRAAP